MTSAVSRRRFLISAGGALAALRSCSLFGSEAGGIAPQAYFAGVSRALEALSKLGAPVASADAQILETLARQNDANAVRAAERILDRYTLIRLSVEAAGYTRSAPGGAKRVLVEQGWRVFLLRASNPFGYADTLTIRVGEGQVGNFSHGSIDQRADLGLAPVHSVDFAPFIQQMWLTAELFEQPPLSRTLSGAPLEYRVIQLSSRDHGARRADLNFYTDQAWIAYVSKQHHLGINLDFTCLPSRTVPLVITDSDGRGCMARLTITDKLERIYPPQSMRLAPDLAFQKQIYRADGEAIRLPDGEYMVESGRGPEYLRGVQRVTIAAGRSNSIKIQLRRWIDPAAYGWYSGDTHIHAAGCSYYNKPTEGVSPETLIRHVRGEALPIGDVLTWRAGYYDQKQFFTGHAESPAATLEHAELQAANNVDWRPQATPEDAESLIRYDMEISGFPSSHAGHLVLLRLKEQEYPATRRIEDWPSWNLPILKWARERGAVAGYAHAGCGMVVDSGDLPNYEVPRFDDCGTNEGIIDVTHDAVDFLSGCEMMPVAELNAWYHLLNCGFRLAMLGETDWPCFFGDRPGTGRTYVRLNHPPVADAGYDDWVRSLQKGRLYCGDGRSHFLKFTVNGLSTGEADVRLDAAKSVNVEADIAAWLEPDATSGEAIRTSPPFIPPCWHLERARIGETREVAIELVVNGIAVDRARLIADGKPRRMSFKIPVARSAWVALRLMPSAHTHPVFVTVAGKPIRASKRSARWCRACVDKLWEVKSPFIRESDRAAAAAAFDHARNAYDRIINECGVA